jgi:MFS family permease
MATSDTAKTRASRLGGFLGLQRSTVGVLAMAVLVGTGERMAERSGKKPFVLATFVFFTLFPLALLYSRSFGWLVAAFVLRGLKEFGEPTRKALIMDLAPDHCKAGMFGLYYLIRDVFVSLAAFGGAFLWQASPRANLITAFAFGAVGTLGFAVFGRDTTSAGPARRST